MNSSELYLEAAELKDNIQQALHHPYIFKHVEPPVIDDDKLLLLCSITDETNSKIRKETIISTMLVQTALDIHERILYIDLVLNDHKTRQLTVLAGDYYSSLYYERLTAINEQQLIRLLAQGIKEINELKTLFLYGENIKVPKLLSTQSKIESNIINQFSIATIGKEISTEFKLLLLLKRLLNEKMLEEKSEHSLWTHLFGRHLNKIKPSNNIELLSANMYKETRQTVDSIIFKKYRKLKTLLTTYENENSVVHIIFDNLTAKLNKLSKFSKEG